MIVGGQFYFGKEQKAVANSIRDLLSAAGDSDVEQ
jgi:hypothetical protein